MLFLDSGARGGAEIACSGRYAFSLLEFDEGCLCRGAESRCLMAGRTGTRRCYDKAVRIQIDLESLNVRSGRAYGEVSCERDSRRSLAGCHAA